MEKYATAAEQRLLEALPQGRLLTTAQIRSFFEQWSRVYLSTLLSQLAKKNKIKKLGRGRYYVPTGQNMEEYRQALFLAGARGAYVSFATALNFHHLLDEVAPVIYVATYSKSSRVTLNGVKLVFVALGDKCIGAEDHGSVLIASKAKAVFDCLLLPRYCGGIETIARALAFADFRPTDWKEFEYYLLEFAPLSLVQRFGFLTENVCKNVRPPKKVLRKMRALAGSSKNLVLLDPRGGKEGPIDEKWRVRINMVV